MEKLHKDLLKVVQDLVSFPNSQVCVHYASLNILSAMIENGVEIPESLVKSIYENSEGDEESIRIIEEII